VLTAASYHTAWAIYAMATLGFLLLVRHWLRPRVGPGTQVTLLLLLAALALTPAQVSPELASYAPAVVVLVFDWLTHGSESVLRPLEPMLLMFLLALGLGLLFTLVGRWLFPPKDSQQ
jgi:hypothetical protein